MNNLFFNFNKTSFIKLNVHFYRASHNATKNIKNSDKREYFNTTEETKILYNHVSKDYEKIMDVSTFKTHNRVRYEVVKQILPIEGTHILDGAGGTGLATSAILKYAANNNLKSDFHITVCDISPGQLNIGKNRIKNSVYEKSIDWIESDIQNLPFQNESFNSYIITYGFRTITDVNKVFQDGFRILKPGGKMAVCDFVTSDKPTIWQRLYYYAFKTIFYAIFKYRFGQGDLALYMAENLLKNPKKEEIISIMEGSGFKNITCIPQMMGIMLIYVGQKL